MKFSAEISQATMNMRIQEDMIMRITDKATFCQQLAQLSQDLSPCAKQATHQLYIWRKIRAY